MTEVLVFSGGLIAGTLGGYLGLGGGIIMVPYLTLLVGLDIKSVIPVSIAAIASNSIATSYEYLRKDMVDLPLATLLALFCVIGFIFGALLMDMIPKPMLLIAFSFLILYATFNIARPRKTTDFGVAKPDRSMSAPILMITFLVGLIAAVLGIGGGIIMVPLLFSFGNRELAISRGTWSYTYGFAATAATLIYFTRGQLVTEYVAPIVAGILLGGKLGAKLGTRAKPAVIKFLFLIILIYSAFKMGYPALKEILF